MRFSFRVYVGVSLVQGKLVTKSVARELGLLQDVMLQWRDLLQRWALVHRCVLASARPPRPQLGLLDLE